MPYRSSRQQLMEQQQSKELFSYFGLAVYYGQALEQQLVNLIMMMKLAEGKVPAEEDLEELYHRKLGNSLGQLVNEIRHHFTFTEEETEELVSIWKDRNRIVHDYFKERILETFSEEGRKAMIQELKQFKDRAKRLEDKLQHYTQQLYEQVEGLDHIQT
ncbi:hypothetical protein AWM70_05455 [Paenibacillus yonginensis]|uniref:Uncharacterized protein n=1 Tax=Paenibacillus yonginensis TaxID=1462996 RepID=A0A1B1MY62_9BACL|nr:hypothetical protein [Paenibacillus yonginensis]ANS74089.1 hypothetical protein AWM70_05455 [Paenibacillus yonginensis]